MTVRDIEQQEDQLQLTRQSPSVQQCLTASSSNITSPGPDGELVSLQMLVNSRLCGGSIDPWGKMLFAQQLFQVRPSHTYHVMNLWEAFLHIAMLHL